jgi:hypothetical protein
MMSQKAENIISEEIQEKENRPSAARLIESLRDTGYIFDTAVADVVDNSVAANATEIRLKLELEFGNSPIVMIADNGDGMDGDGVDDAMKYGAPERDSKKSLGKFGIGLKTASTSICRKLTVISKKTGDYNIKQWDLDVVSKKDKWILLEPSLDDYAEHIAFLEDLTQGGSGTLIIWEKVDRLIRFGSEGTARNQLEKAITEISRHLSGVFYNFLETGNGFPDITIKVNDQYIKPWDPFCRWMNSNGKRVDIHKNSPFHIIQEKDGKEEIVGTFYVNAYILPNKNTLTQEEIDKSRFGLDAQGFYVFREGRMIQDGGWPNRIFVKESHLNLLRVELLFDHQLDDYFQIDIKKSRIDLPKDIRDELKRILAPARNEANRRYRTAGVKSSKQGPKHDASGNVIGKHHDETTSGSEVETIDKDKGEATISNRYGITKVKLKVDENQDCVVQTRDTLEDGVLWVPGLVEGNLHAVFLNESHEFYKRFYYANKDNQALVLAMDAILWSLAEAELCVLSNTVRKNLEEMRISVSRSLRILAEELPEVDESENNAEEDI